MNDQELREELALLAHTQWRNWMEYLFSKCDTDSDGGMRIPRWAVERWMGQAAMPYALLLEEEKHSDRAEADKVLAIVKEHS